MLLRWGPPRSVSPMNPSVLLCKLRAIDCRGDVHATCYCPYTVQMRLGFCGIQNRLNTFTRYMTVLPRCGHHALRPVGTEPKDVVHVMPVMKQRGTIFPL